MTQDPHQDPHKDPHKDQPIHRLGPSLESAAGAVIMLHGRGASADDILNLAQAMYHSNLAYLAPAAEAHRWYPERFIAPREQNEPWLTSALNKVGATIQLAIDAGVPTNRIVVCGFSQGACLSTEYVATHPARYAGLFAFTGGLIGPLGMPMNYSGDLQGTPAFLGCGDPDPHIPWERVQESADVLEKMNARVTLRRYPGRAHTVSADEVRYANAILNEAFGSPRA